MTEVSNIQYLQPALFVATTALASTHLFKYMPQSNRAGITIMGITAAVISAIPNKGKYILLGERKYTLLDIGIENYCLLVLEGLIDTALPATAGATLAIALSKLFPKKVSLSKSAALRLSAIPIACSGFSIELDHKRFSRYTQYEHYKDNPEEWNNLPADDQTKLAQSFYKFGFSPSEKWNLKDGFNSDNFKSAPSFDTLNISQLEWYILLQRERQLELEISRLLDLLEQSERCQRFTPIIHPNYFKEIKENKDLFDRVRNFFFENPTRVTYTGDRFNKQLIDAFFKPPVSWENLEYKSFRFYWYVMTKKILILDTKNLMDFNMAVVERCKNMKFLFLGPGSFEDYIQFIQDSDDLKDSFYTFIEKKPKLLTGVPEAVLERLRTVLGKDLPKSTVE